MFGNKKWKGALVLGGTVSLAAVLSSFAVSAIEEAANASEDSTVVAAKLPEYTFEKRLCAIEAGDTLETALGKGFEYLSAIYDAYNDKFNDVIAYAKKAGMNVDELKSKLKDPSNFISFGKNMGDVKRNLCWCLEDLKKGCYEGAAVWLSCAEFDLAYAQDSFARVSKEFDIPANVFELHGTASPIGQCCVKDIIAYFSGDKRLDEAKERFLVSKECEVCSAAKLPFFKV